MITDPYTISEVDATQPDTAAALQAFNSRFPDDFLPLKPSSLAKGSFWWLVTLGPAVVAFAGMVPFEPFPRVGYFKRGAVLPDHRGKGLQSRLMATRLAKAAVATDWTHIMSECHVESVQSANNHIRAGFTLVECARPWEKETLLWRRALSREVPSPRTLRTPQTNTTMREKW